MCNSRDQNTLPVTNKANSNHLLSESKDLKFSQKLSLVFDFDTHFYSLGRQRKKKIFEPPFCGHIFWKAVSSVGTEPLKHFQFPAEGHCKVFIYLTDSLALLALFCYTAHCRSKYILKMYFKTDLPIFPSCSCFLCILLFPFTSDLLTRGG